MPNYDYRCDACRKSFSLTRSWEEFDKKPTPKCPKCGKKKDVRQILSNVQVQTSKKS